MEAKKKKKKLKPFVIETKLVTLFNLYLELK